MLKTKTSYQIRYIITRSIFLTLLILGAFGIYYRISGSSTDNRLLNGPILFWQSGALYTINPNGTQLKKITPASQTLNRRQISISSGCYTASSVGCRVLIKHVLYDALGEGVPLPITDTYVWINTPSVWSPDGRHIAYMVGQIETGDRILLVYDVEEKLIWRVADGINDAITPAWSLGCVDLSAGNCYLAYALKTKQGQVGNLINAKNMKTGDDIQFQIASGRGHVLRWSDTDELYYGGGEVGWFNVRDNQPFMVLDDAVTFRAESPIMAQTAFITVPSPEMPSELMLQRRDNTSTLLHVFTNQDGDERSAPPQIIWHPDGKSFLAIDQGELIRYNIEQAWLETLYHHNGAYSIQNYVSSPDGKNIALVETSISVANPTYRLFVVTRAGEVITLIPSSQTPIIVLAWLSANYEDFLLPAEGHDLL